jgi:hypothetical protein
MAAKWGRSKQQMHQTTKKWWYGMNQQMHQTNEDVAMWQPTMAQAKCRCDDTAIKKCASQM